MVNCSLGKQLNPLCVALYYHSIFPKEKESFRKQMDLVIKKSTVIKSDHQAELGDNGLYTIITFDDAFENLILNAVPILEEKNIPFTIFFISDYFGQLPNWEFPEGHSDTEQKIMSVEQMKSLPESLLTIGSHTKSHKKLNKLEERELVEELVGSKKTLEDLSGKEVTILSFPNGEYNDLVIQKSFEAGYERLYTIDPMFSLKEPKEKVTGRVWTNGNDWFPEFWLKLHGGYCWLDSAIRFKNKILNRN
jgi:peptidoglycan/xylan/chitin deacetylase (PgdA/CDA1 family)